MILGSGLESLNYPGIPIWLLVIVIAWTLVWDALALWKSARLKQPVWFIVILLVNTLGILEMLYLFIFSRMGFAQEVKKPKKLSRRKKRK